MSPSSATRPRKAAEAQKKRATAKGSRGGSQALWPLLIFIVLDPFLVHAASILALEGTKPFTLVFPWVEFFQLPIFRFTAETMTRVTQWVLYLQFPVYGLLMTLTWRVDRRFRAILYGLVAHFGGFLLVVSLAYV
jgi:hypothetical protein